ncbi:DctP family TRAP transporter solute-binding subunit [Chengkuizengella axinellae]|uniref:DctP family TRAP transporter solute-binding subunit n=1 Tax=Chengkuizengella axinellae TaxID=3064388 RepID=A0ABT9J6C4_9BACL|nr:DctP family TRAP transporter solute-binding subunit [Chengkuizengella sp. 2205SS18-9]MDP5276509.1 DctP family TRAP transporter solute-binding subunit [Chengkuizengella sp. 2205SS18-9]
MKKLMYFSILFMILFILTLVMIFKLFQSQEKLAFDDEQFGLKDQIVIRFSHVVAENTPKGLAAKYFAELVSQKTSHNVKVEIFANGSLYTDDTEALHALKQGEIQMMAPATSKLTTSFPEWQLVDLPFVFPSYKAATEAFNGKIGKELFSLLEKENLKGLSFWSNGFKQMTSHIGPIHMPEDLAGQHFRIMPSKIIEEQYNLLNVKTSMLPFNSTYQSLETHTVTGQENTLSNIYSKKFYRVQEHLTISNHGFLGYVVLMNDDFWNQLPMNIQEIIIESMNEASEIIQNKSIELNQQSLKNIKNDSDIQIYELIQTEKDKWIEYLQPVYEQYELEFGNDLTQELYKIHNKYEVE